MGTLGKIQADVCLELVSVPAFSGNIGLVLRVAVVNVDFVLPPSSNEPLVSPKFYPALLDTGARVTCVPKRVVEECSLDGLKATKHTGVTGETDVEQYAFGIGFFVPSGNPSPSGGVCLGGASPLLFCYIVAVSSLRVTL